MKVIIYDDNGHELEHSEPEFVDGGVVIDSIDKCTECDVHFGPLTPEIVAEWLWDEFNKDTKDAEYFCDTPFRNKQMNEARAVIRLLQEFHRRSTFYATGRDEPEFYDSGLMADDTLSWLKSL